MNASLPVNTSYKTMSSSSQEHGHASPFSRASHFAMILLVPTAGVAYSLIANAQGSSLFRAMIFGWFLFGLGSGLSILKVVSRIEDSEKL